MRWQCRWRGCEKWAQSNGYVLCNAHLRENAILLEHNYSGAEALANLRNDSIAAPAENDPPVDGPPFFPVDKNRRRCLQPRPLLVVAREVPGVREHETEQRAAARDEPGVHKQEQSANTF